MTVTASEPHHRHSPGQQLHNPSREVPWIAEMIGSSAGDAIKFLNDEYLEAQASYPGEFDLMANAHALDESSLPVIEEIISQNDAKAIAVSSSYGDGADRLFLDSPKAEWLWEYAEANDIVVHVHPPMIGIGHEVLMEYRLNEALARPFDSAVNGARMIASGLFDRHPKLQVLLVQYGGALTSVLGRLEFNSHLNYDGVQNPPLAKTYKNSRHPSEYFKTNILVDCMGFSAIALRAAVEMCGVDRVVYGSDYGPLPYGIKEHVQIVEDVLPNPADQELCSPRQATESSAWASQTPIPVWLIQLTEPQKRSQPSRASEQRCPFAGLGLINSA